MPITINLDDEAIDFLAARIALKLAGMDSSQNVNPPAENTHRTQTAPVSGDDGWDSTPPAATDSAPDSRPADSRPDSTPDSAPEGPNVRPPRCEHGDMRYVKAGYGRTGSYDAFYGCASRDRNGPKCKGITAAEWIDRVKAQG